LLCRVALGGCPPRAPTDPYVHTLGHTVPRDMGSLRDVGVDDSERRERVSFEQPVESIPSHLATVVAAVKPLPPGARHCVEEACQCRGIASDPVVRLTQLPHFSRKMAFSGMFLLLGGATGEKRGGLAMCRRKLGKSRIRLCGCVKIGGRCSEDFCR
jgi:hypothetical protein